ncbi:hypothetical protein METBIDRAFT_35512 [Metschnikowia bicuspidata var. bicuspidata NRRL YB-4993]|uniref:FYVE-type domain-containing protein n=1 Tax=Metschnikowia bicuspidata var. bicuspidata NRRL YB-4993 TaxID=869754 RepID=A0A1A0HH72_9ASCO|nr:hypothetical protein METBIDRAFT_35512 [Metschnikowia bicuspidata var. bicuspidata NRRL YB-4993]OBA23227.1 hypothetical protein METBIDRAFT_35512 [Metschnikowia bicuspidata var. bicuspidata NRRL YB-4993]
MDGKNDGSQDQAPTNQKLDLWLADSPFLDSANPGNLEAATSYTCPICGEMMISLGQLNRHIDDLHSPKSDTMSDINDSDSPRAFLKEKNASSSHLTPQKRSLKLELHEHSSRFSLSENGSNADSLDPVKLTRSHWKHVSQKGPQTCAAPVCTSILNVRNGIVNCRKCGNLFCNQHTRFRARLNNGQQDPRSKIVLPVYDSKKGVMAKVCQGCYMAKPGVKLGTQVYSVNLTDEFMAKRRRTIDEKQLARSMIHSRFLKLADLHSQGYLYHLQNEKNLLLYFGALSKTSPFSKERILEAEKEIVGVENWQPDENVSHCKLCFEKFNFLVRKHHCRLCGSVVNDGIFDVDGHAELCSVQVPMGLLLAKLDMLNYSPVVKSNWDTLVLADLHAASTSFSIRVCKTCKNSLLHSLHVEAQEGDQVVADVLDAYDQMLKIKATIINSMARYHMLVRENKEAQNHQTNKLRVRLRKAVKDLEIMVNSFMNRFFAVDPKLKKLKPLHNARLVTNIYKALAAYLQEVILELKDLNDSFQSAENQKLAGQLGAFASTDSTSISNSLLSTTVLPVPTPRLTKKQIRELREQLMVTTEQRFIIENLIEDVKRQRKFDELITLEENKKELSAKIDELNGELGEFAF